MIWLQRLIVAVWRDAGGTRTFKLMFYGPACSRSFFVGPTMGPWATCPPARLQCVHLPENPPCQSKLWSSWCGRNAGVTHGSDFAKQTVGLREHAHWCLRFYTWSISKLIRILPSCFGRLWIWMHLHLIQKWKLETHLLLIQERSYCGNQLLLPCLLVVWRDVELNRQFLVQFFPEILWNSEVGVADGVSQIEEYGIDSSELFCGSNGQFGSVSLIFFHPSPSENLHFRIYIDRRSLFHCSFQISNFLSILIC